ncbi:MAG: hypothetical protein ACOC21_01545 [Halanaerobiales bacterium]
MSTSEQPEGTYVKTRRYEVAAAINRLRSLQFERLKY